jgi:hypothetical protein
MIKVCSDITFVFEYPNHDSNEHQEYEQHYNIDAEFIGGPVLVEDPCQSTVPLFQVGPCFVCLAVQFLEYVLLPDNFLANSLSVEF